MFDFPHTHNNINSNKLRHKRSKARLRLRVFEDMISPKFHARRVGWENLTHNHPKAPKALKYHGTFR